MLTLGQGELMIVLALPVQAYELFYESMPIMNIITTIPGVSRKLATNFQIQAF